MNQELTKKIQRTYPDIMTHTIGSSAYPIRPECGFGWYRILFEIVGLIRDIQVRTGGPVSISQIKEKFGMLRIYATMPINSIEDDLLETVMEIVSSQTCELCGEPGRQHSTGGWLSTFCDYHVENQPKTQADIDALEAKVTKEMLSHERQGLVTKGLVFINITALKKDDDTCAKLEMYEFPDRLAPINKAPMMSQLNLTVKVGTTDELSAFIKSIDKEKTVTTMSDMSQAARKALA